MPRFSLTLFLAGDVMTGRGIDQVLRHPSDPQLHEGYVRDARTYVALAEEVNGPIAAPVGFDYIWGDALGELERVQPAVRIINLETGVTRSDDWFPKGINYRMHPRNVACLTAARIDCCVLANNHVLDWGQAGLVETLRVLGDADLATAGAGRNAQRAWAPAVLQTAGGVRVLVFAFGHESSGIPPDWAATYARPGVAVLPDLSARTAEVVAEHIQAHKHPKDVVVASVHWGGNWGYGISEVQRRFAHALVEDAGVDIVHGHSSHHPKGIELHRGRVIFYGCGDLLNDYEGIRGHERYRGELSLLYFLTVDPESGELRELRMSPMRMRRLRLEHASEEEARFLVETLDREHRELGGRGVEQAKDGQLRLLL